MCIRGEFDVRTQENVVKCKWQEGSVVYCQVVGSIFMSNMIFLSYAGRCFR